MTRDDDGEYRQVCDAFDELSIMAEQIRFWVILGVGVPVITAVLAAVIFYLM